MLTDEEQSFLQRGRVARFASIDSRGYPHVLPICYAMEGARLYFTIDEKPKRSVTDLARLRNIRADPKVSVVVDHYEEDWSKLGWLMIQGTAEVLESGTEHESAQRLLRERYPQLRPMRLGRYPVVAVQVERRLRWGQLRS